MYDEIRFLVDFAVVVCKQSLRNSVADAPVTRTPYGTSEKRADSLFKPPLLPFKHKHIQGNTCVTLYISSLVHRKPPRNLYICL